MMTNLGLKTPNCDYRASHSSSYGLQVSARTRNGALIVHRQYRHHLRPCGTLYFRLTLFESKLLCPCYKTVGNVLR